MNHITYKLTTLKKNPPFHPIVSDSLHSTTKDIGRINERLDGRVKIRLPFFSLYIKIISAAAAAAAPSA